LLRDGDESLSNDVLSIPFPSWTLLLPTI
jgi:hypothetical protein